MRISDWSSDVCSSDLRRRRAQDRAYIVRICHLIEHDQRALVVAAPVEQIAEPDVLERFDFADVPLMRRVARPQPLHVCYVGLLYRSSVLSGMSRSVRVFFVCLFLLTTNIYTFL